MTKGLVFAALLTLSTQAFADKVCDSYMPPNKMNYPESPIAGGITRAEFDQVLDRVQQVYGPIVQQMGGTLSIDRNWSNGQVNAYAERNGTTWIISMYGGFARHPKVTTDAFMAVACHELGHHLGGAPQFKNDWASIEGQSDYYSSLKCLRRMFEQDDNQKILNGMTLDPAAVAACKSQHGSKQDELVCIRSTMAGISLAEVLAQGSSARPALLSPDKSEVTKTYTAHPEAQCRLDTVFEAALCRIPFAQDVDASDYQIGSCYSPDHTRGARPRCWFKPN
jgi:hypothetical protein